MAGKTDSLSSWPALARVLTVVERRARRAQRAARWLRAAAVGLTLLLVLLLGDCVHPLSATTRLLVEASLIGLTLGVAVCRRSGKNAPRRRLQAAQQIERHYGWTHHPLVNAVQFLKEESAGASVLHKELIRRTLEHADKVGGTVDSRQVVSARGVAHAAAGLGAAAIFWLTLLVVSPHLLQQGWGRLAEPVRNRLALAWAYLPRPSATAATDRPYPATHPAADKTTPAEQEGGFDAVAANARLTELMDAAQLLQQQAEELAARLTGMDDAVALPDWMTDRLQQIEQRLGRFGERARLVAPAADSLNQLQLPRIEPRSRGAAGVWLQRIAGAARHDQQLLEQHFAAPLGKTREDAAGVSAPVPTVRALQGVTQDTLRRGDRRDQSAALEDAIPPAYRDWVAQYFDRLNRDAKAAPEQHQP